MKVTKDKLDELDPDQVVSVENLVIEAGPFKRTKVRLELSHAGFAFKEYKHWWGSDFKILGEYKVQRLINLFDWLDGNTEIIRSGTASEVIQRTIVRPRF